MAGFMSSAPVPEALHSQLSPVSQEAPARLIAASEVRPQPLGVPIGMWLLADLQVSLTELWFTLQRHF